MVFLSGHTKKQKISFKHGGIVQAWLKIIFPILFSSYPCYENYNEQIFVDAGET